MGLGVVNVRVVVDFCVFCLFVLVLWCCALVFHIVPLVFVFVSWWCFVCSFRVFRALCFIFSCVVVSYRFSGSLF